jgi:hypothetical protein
MSIPLLITVKIIMAQAVANFEPTKKEAGITEKYLAPIKIVSKATSAFKSLAIAPIIKPHFG